MFGATAKYQDLTIKGGLGGIDVQLGDKFKKHYDDLNHLVNDLGPIIYPFYEAAAKAEQGEAK